MGSPETCNALDDDCDGSVDEMFGCVQNAPVNCTTACGTMGTGHCSASCTLPTGTMCSVPLETCNGTDDDCDGVADEDIQVVGSAVTAASMTSASSPHVFPHGPGYDVLYIGGASNHLFLQYMDANGVSLTPVDLGVSVQPYAAIAAVPIGLATLVLYESGGSYYIQRVTATGGMVFPTPYALPLGSGEMVYNRVVIGAANATDAYFYVGYRTAAPVYGVHYLHLNVVGPSPTVIDQGDLPPQLATRGAWSEVTTTQGDFFALGVLNGDIQIFQRANGASTFTFLGPAAIGVSPAVIVIAQDASSELGLAWMPTGGAISFEVFGHANSTILPSSVGAASSSPPSPQLLSIVAVPNASSYMVQPHWLVAANETDAFLTAGQLQIWEVTGGVFATATATPITVPAETQTNGLYDISMAGMGGQFRVAEATGSGSIVTRSVGCR
jgi:hypothetical protein